MVSDPDIFELERWYVSNGAAARAEEVAKHPELRTGRPPRRTPRPAHGEPPKRF